MNLSKKIIPILLALGLITGCSLNKENENVQTTEAQTTLVAMNTQSPVPVENGSSSNASKVEGNLSQSDNERQGELGEFYVPLPKEKKEIKDVEVRGLYLDPDTAGMNFSQDNIDSYIQYIEGLKQGNEQNEEAYSHVNKLEKALAMAQSTDINSLVIDIKTDSGNIAWKSDIEAVNNFDASLSFSNDDFKSLIDYMKSHNIHSIARIVVFKDPILSNAQPEHAIKLKTGEVFKDYANQSWLNPFDEYVWKYTVAVSQEAALRGFDEIHFDYVRFPENAADYNDLIELEGRNDQPKDEGITQFLAYAKEHMEPYGVKVGAAIFGTTTTSWEDQPEDIGQTWRKIAKYVDRISPMVYPSHYTEGWFGIKVPDTEPYKFIYGATKESLQRNGLVENPSAYTPWIQAFTATWIDGHIEYTPEVIHEQIRAIQELGHNSYLMWNASGRYLPITFIQPHAQSEIAENQDAVGRTVSEAINLYFANLEKAEDERDNIMIYTLTPIASRPEDYNTFKYNLKNEGLVIKGYTIEEGNENTEQKVIVSYTKNGETHENVEINVSVIKESGLYKINLPNEFFNLTDSI